MSALIARGGVARRRLAVAVVTAAGVALSAPAAGADDLTARYEVVGRVVYLTADLASPHEDQHFAEGSVTTAYSDVDGTLVDLSAVQEPRVGTAPAAPESLPAGAGVAVTIEAPAGLADPEAAALVSGGGAAAETGTAEVVAAVVTDEATTRDPAPTAAMALGVHQLVIVPVRWTDADSVPVAALTTAAAGTESYWERQSGGQLDIQQSVRAAVTVPKPATCDVDGLLEAVIGATGLAPTTRLHVALALPDHPGCPWAGLASINGGAIWLNDAPFTYVLAHELGHNFGLGHANTLTCTAPGGSRVPLSASGTCYEKEYGDNTDVMGQGRNLDTPGNLSSAPSFALGWSSVHLVGNAVQSTTSLDLPPLSQASGTRGVRFQSEMGTVFVDYRPAVGADALHEPGWAGVQARLAVTDPVYDFLTTYLLDLQPERQPFTNPSLPVGRSWEIAGAGATLTTTTLGATARVTISPTSATTALQRYVTRVYEDLFDRQPDPQGLTTWTSGLAAGTPRVAVANAITYSDEYRSRLIAATYQTYLGRGPDPAGAAGWLDGMRAGSTIQQLEVGFVASDEYYAKAGGTDTAWVGRLYQHVLGRSAAPSEIRGWTTGLARGASRSQVALGFLVSTEHLTTVVDGYYVDLLGRHIDATGARSWVAAIQAGTRVEAIIGGIIASDEYFGRP
ncbi:DUF4214 domain-containing protein [Cellulosimicrobium cellulans]|uniref:DUF4214 domain-containing protein n=1 Tax=Cellulosimicrobium cellulans TaxID=1710 RepID=UPI00130EB82C|nr:DUF4214 domain-containing protein [Cellulosimicrobium cellulans]